MINPKTIVLMLIVIAAVLIGITIPSQYVTASFCTNMLSQDADVDTAEDVAAGNATMMKNQTANGNMTGVEFLSIQTAHSGSISQINTTAYTLELNNIANDTIQFSDRPNRIVETVSTADFIGNWSNGPDSFASDAPNDVLIVENTQTGNLETSIIESFDPTYGTNTNTLTYTIMAENTTAIELPSQFGQSILVIDSIPSVL